MSEFLNVALATAHARHLAPLTVASEPGRGGRSQSRARGGRLVKIGLVARGDVEELLLDNLDG
jgi:hypothetical protein